MSPPRLFLLVLLTAATAAPCHAQFASLQGRVTDPFETPLSDANVVLQDDSGTRWGSATDARGRYHFGGLLPGRYTFAVSLVGYATERDTLQLSFGERRRLDVVLEAATTRAGEVVVEEQRSDEGPRGAGLETIRPEALARIPTPGLSADLASYLQALPGVVAVGDRGGQFFVRGGSPTQNLVLLDGIPVYQPFHIVGFYSAFPADIVSYADVYAGGFGARYGGRLSSVIDVTTRNGNKRRVQATASVAPFLSALYVELPVVPEKVSVVASVRESVIERVAPDLLGTQLPYRFGDRFAKLHAFLNQTSSLSLTALRTADAGDVTNTENDVNRVRWRNEAYGGRYLYLPPMAATLLQTSAYFTRFTSGYTPFGAPARESEVKGFGGEMSFTYFFERAELQFGVFGRTNTFRYDLGVGGSLLQDQHVTEGGLFVLSRLDAGRALHLEPGLRLHAFRGGTTLAPRLRGTYRPGGPSGPHRFSFALGRYHQQIIGLYNLRDVTDAFVAWRPTPDHTAVPQADHLLAGWSGRLTGWLELTTEAYVKRMRDMAIARYNDVGQRRTVVETVDGAARGVDLRATLARGPFYGYVGYGLARVTYESHLTGERFAPPHDRRHQLNVLARVQHGRYAVSARWQFGSGLPFTRAVGFYDELARITLVDDAYHTATGPVQALFGEPYRGRLPTYHRLDVSLAYTLAFRHAEATLQASVINAYDRANLFDYDLFTQQRINQLPLIPSVGVKVALR